MSSSHFSLIGMVLGVIGPTTESQTGMVGGAYSQLCFGGMKKNPKDVSNRLLCFCHLFFKKFDYM